MRTNNKKYEGANTLMTSQHLCAMQWHERKAAMPKMSIIGSR